MLREKEMHFKGRLCLCEQLHKYIYRQAHICLLLEYI